MEEPTWTKILDCPVRLGTTTWIDESDVTTKLYVGTVLK